MIFPELYVSGNKLPILTVVPRKKEIQNLNIGDNMVYIYETKGIKLNTNI
jgi:hypothetical protein